MKNKVYLIITGLFLLTVQVKAQSPGSFNYQGVARNAGGAVLANQAIGLEFTIHQGSATGTKVYEETQSDTTNQFGLFSVAIGKGTVVTGSFAGIGWGANSEYLEVAMDPSGGTTYTDMGTQQLLSVPYALYAASSGNAYTAGTGIGVTSNVISANTTDALWNANKIEGDSVSITAPTTGQVLQWNGAAWAPATFAAGGNGWNLTGNSGITYGTDFIGTTDDEGLLFEMDGTISGKIEDNTYNANTALGFGSLQSSNGVRNAAFGYYALNSNNSGSYNVALGSTALLNNHTASNNTAVGAQALYYNDYNNEGGSTATNNTAIGYNAMEYNTAGSNNTSMGENALNQNHLGNDNTAMGYLALYNDDNDVSGSGNNNTAVGDNAMYNTIDGAGNTALGMNALNNSQYSNNNTALGYNADISSDALNNATAIGYNATVSASNTVQLGSGCSVQFDEALMPAGNAGTPGEVLQSNGAGAAPTWGTPSAWSLTGNSGTLYGPNFIGTTDDMSLLFEVNDHEAGRIEDNSNAFGNTALGYESLQSIQLEANENVALGYAALFSNQVASNNTAIGYEALYNNDLGGPNVANNNTAVGYKAMLNNMNGTENTALGTNALNNNQNSNYNTAIGYQADIASDGINNATAIGANAVAVHSNTVILGDSTDNVNVGIGTGAPATDAGLGVKGLHLETMNGSTAASVAAQSGAGTSSTATFGANGGTDVGGAISITTGSGSYATGTQATVTFGTPYTTAPTVVITPTDGPTALAMNGQAVYVSSTTTGFSINFYVAASSATTYNFNYFVIETK